MPGSERSEKIQTETGLLWNFNTNQPRSNKEIIISETGQPSATSTPQLYKPIDFDEAFTRSASISNATVPNYTGAEKDAAQWLFFDPVEYSATNIETLYAVFENSGNGTWDENYYLEFFAGYNPCKTDKIFLAEVIQPGERGTFVIPISSSDSSWKACWQIKNKASVPFYEFCYNHGSGQNNNYANISANNGSPNVIDVAAGVAGKEGYFAFQKTIGSAPEKYSSESQAAALVSTSPDNGHTFQAYDHFESLSVTFRNDGTASWDSSYALKFYSGYNWFHETSFAVPDTVSAGETVTITMPMEIIEDNDKWVTCWYLSTPDGKNLYDFCYDYRTGG